MISSIYTKLSEGLKVDTSGSRVSSSKKPAIALAIIGIALGLVLILSGVGLWALNGLNALTKQFANPVEAKAKASSLDLPSRLDALVADGKLAQAVALLENEENERGLSVQLSNKLDGFYILQAKQLGASGKKNQALAKLKLIPAESSKWTEAQALVHSINAAHRTDHALGGHGVKSKKHHARKHHG